MYNNVRSSRSSVRTGSQRKSFGSRPSNKQSFSSNKQSFSSNGGGFSSRNISSGSNSFGRSSRSGGYANSGGYSSGYSSRGRSGGNFKQRTFSDINVFIKKAAESIDVTEYASHHTFEDFNLSTPLKQNIASKGYTMPTPIQDQSIQPILDGKDLIGLAKTGTGKTAAFLIPLIDKMFKTRDQRLLIITPTRELALQINEEFRSFARDMHLYSALIIGGTSMYRQISDIRRNPHVVIATPGRLKDLIERKVIYLEDYSNIVLDEVDMMVDIGFINDIKYFISRMPKVRQSLFFSATISMKIREILQSFVKDPVTITIKQEENTENVEQDVVRVLDKNKKVDQLHDLLIQDAFEKVLVFGRTKHGIEKLHKELVTRGFKTEAIHGNKSQNQRQRALSNFKQNQIQILLATDVASRGLDIDNVTHVINYELPETYEDYIHRIGRTGRAGNKGVALTFID